MAKSSISEQSILAALSIVQDPELHKDLVSLNMVKDIQITGNDVSLSIILTTPACPLRTKIENDARTALQLIPGIGNIRLIWGQMCRMMDTIVECWIYVLRTPSP